MDPKEMHSYLMSQHRNVYQEAQLFEQNRKPVNSYLQDLVHPLHPEMAVKFSDDKLTAENKDVFSIKNSVVDFRTFNKDDAKLNEQWEQLNDILVNYQRFLTPYVLLNSLPI